MSSGTTMLVHGSYEEHSTPYSEGPVRASEPSSTCCISRTQRPHSQWQVCWSCVRWDGHRMPPTALRGRSRRKALGRTSASPTPPRPPPEQCDVVTLLCDRFGRPSSNTGFMVNRAPHHTFIFLGTVAPDFFTIRRTCMGCTVSIGCYWFLRFCSFITQSLSASYM